MKFNELTARLDTALQSISNLLITFSVNDWQRPQGEKWTLAAEFEHLCLSTQATAFILSTAGRLRWHPYAGESRSYDTIVTEYQAGLLANPGIGNAATRPTDAAQNTTIDHQRANWSRVTSMVLVAAAAITEAELDTNTVWKHPLLGPLTVWEMILFTIHHTDHHLSSMTGKQGLAIASR